MTDNIPVKPSNATTAVSVATDDVSNVHYPIYKMAVGGDGSANLVSSANPVPVELPADPLPITVSNAAVPVSFPTDGPNFDAFDRLRTSEPTTLFDSKQLFDNQPLFWDDSEVSGSGTTSSHSVNTASTTIGVGATTAGKRVRQTFMRFNYQPGKSQLVLLTGVLDKTGGGTGITRCMGLYDDENGIYLQDNEGTLEFVRRTYTSGSAVNNAVAQSSWNLDKMDGTGASGVTIDVSKANIFVLDFEWLGVGRVRVGFVVDGIIYYAHQFLNTNVLSSVYMSTPNLPVRYEIENDGTGAASTLEHICCSVMSEGGTHALGSLRYSSTGSTAINANSVGTIYVICAIRLKATHLDATIHLERISMSVATNDDFEWLLVLNPTVANAVSWSDLTNGSVQTAPGNAGNPSNSTVTGGVVMDGGYVKAGGSGAINTVTNNAIRLGAAIDGTRDELYLCCRPLSANADVYGSMSHREVS